MQGGKKEVIFPKHFDGRRFYNPDAPQASGLLNVLRWKLKSRPEKSPKFVDDVRQTVPVRRFEGSGLRSTLVNHSTVLLQDRRFNILTDPIWSERTSPLSWIGPRRHRKPGIAFENLPALDAVLISHNHFDHLDLPTLRRLASTQKTTFVVPSHLTGFLLSHDIGPVQEMDWGESFSFGGFTVHCVPALHFSARGVGDRNKTLWCGYVIETQERIIYFAADTAYGPHFTQIREKFGSPQVALLPIGAYAPRWFMSPVHMGPEEAIRAHQELGAQTSVAIHHGTFQLADDGIDTPKNYLATLGKPDNFVVLANSESVDTP
jgi:L-ascorbate metabolism protein UlaG (beta-lactamase superfamily)